MTRYKVIGDGILSPISFETLCGPSHFIVPIFLNPEQFAGPVDYVQNVSNVYARSISREVQPDKRV
jgi:hypothetical protein